MLQKTILPQEQRQHLGRLCSVQQLVLHQDEGTLLLAGHDSVHQLENRAFRGRGCEGGDIVGCDGRTIPDVGGNL